MISKNTIKLINSLSIKKYRQKEKLFLVEGDKNVLEVLNSEYNVARLLATNTFLSEHSDSVQKAKQIDKLNPEEIKKASLLKTPQNCLAICELPEEHQVPHILDNHITLYLDGIQDPGNLGTIIRICDWFGINRIFCSPDTTDFYNPKVIQASMGSFCRVKVIHSVFENIIELANHSQAEIVGAFLDGKNIYSEKIPSKIILVVGNEGNGIRSNIESLINTKIMIPSFAEKSSGAESLNVGVATGIICAEIKRQQSFYNYSK